MGDQFKNVMIGIFVIAAISIMVFMMLFLHPNVGNEGKTVRVLFGDIDKISEGTRVTFAGKPVGEVLEIKEIDAGERIEHNGIIYVYELLLAVDTGVEIYTTDEITSRTSGLLGEKSVAITPRMPKKGHSLLLVTNETLYADETGSVESTLKEFKNLTDKIEVTLDGFIETFSTLKKDRFWDNLGEIAKNMTEISDVLNQPNKINDILTKASTGVQNFVDAGTSVNSILATIQAGEGSIGKMLYKDDFYLRLGSLLSKGEVIFNDINHYGLLFHLDKGWQRLRARRLNLLQKLCTPQEFRNYFNDEIDTISTSLERVSDVLEQVDNCPCEPLWKDPAYQKVYSELLRRVAMLEEYLQMYNQQVNDCAVEQTEFININY